ncbi:hypothetical protein Y1Q_0008869 [Alligator mississippiensis]|uniref:Uncharacterized protein n=1 Tax=Alligator mississippiensis TaxID=8496 RepID=A0A151NAA7_ALLMI|nr:hypothetical protein Y1Q_0008869 [Alligator mississippiensis]
MNSSLGSANWLGPATGIQDCLGQTRTYGHPICKAHSTKKGFRRGSDMLFLRSHPGLTNELILWKINEI